MRSASVVSESACLSISADSVSPGFENQSGRNAVSVTSVLQRYNPDPGDLSPVRRAGRREGDFDVCGAKDKVATCLEADRFFRRRALDYAVGQEFREICECWKCRKVGQHLL